MRTFECRTKPVAAAARPVNAFSREITTGMSAPPIGSTNRIPNSPAAPTIATRIQKRTSTIAQAPSPIAPARRAAFPNFCAGYVIGRPDTSSCSFANATIEPANEIDPMIAETTVEIPRSTPTFPPHNDAVNKPQELPCAAHTPWNSTTEMSAAAPPPTPLNSATICGIAVIFTARAAYAPIGVETSITIRIDQ